jgi:hypothetical protein
LGARVGCQGEELVEQPFKVARFGDPVCGEEDMGALLSSSLCYLVTVSTDSYTASKMYPTNCVYDETPQNLPECAASYTNGSSTEEDLADYQKTATTRTSGTYTVDVENFFTLSLSFGLVRRFVCKVAVSSNGAPFSLANNTPNTAVKVHYKTGGVWHHLVNLAWNNYNGAVNKYRADVHVFGLVAQGVQINQIQKLRCDVTSNGYTDSMVT